MFGLENRYVQELVSDISWKPTLSLRWCFCRFAWGSYAGYSEWRYMRILPS